MSSASSPGLPDLQRCALWACAAPADGRCMGCERLVCRSHATVELADMTFQIEGLFCDYCWFDLFLSSSWWGLHSEL
jgi:hypothetical protein